MPLDDQDHYWDQTVENLKPCKDFKDFQARLEMLKTLDPVIQSLERRYLKGYINYLLSRDEVSPEAAGELFRQIADEML